MKRLILLSGLMLMVATAAMAQSGPMRREAIPRDPIKVPVGEDRPARPVPEPGTMALASMGLIALGAAARGRRK